MTLAIGSRIDPPFAGASTTNGPAGRVITFPSALASATFHATVQYSVADNGSGGQIEVRESSKTINGFTFYNPGAAGLAVTWGIVAY